MNHQHDRVALVTGASRGIGAAIARRLARDGFAVVVNYANNAGDAGEVVKAIESHGGYALAVQGDISSPAVMTGLFDAAEHAFGRVDVLVNNAGTMIVSSIADAETAMFDLMVATNLKGLFNGLREGAHRLAEGGRIISFSSSAVGLYKPGYAIYAATKAGVEAMTHVVAKELGPRNITVNAVAPGPVATSLFLTGKSQAHIDEIARQTPLGRIGQATDVADVVAFLAGPDGAWVTGQVLRANGGII